MDLAKAMGVETGYKPLPTNRSHLSTYLPKSQDELPKRKMQDSFLIGFIPLSKDTDLQDKYITFLGHVRVGRLLEDMDIFAGISIKITNEIFTISLLIPQLWLRNSTF